MTNIFSDPDAVGVNLAADNTELEAVATVCIFAREIVGGEVTDEDITDELEARGIHTSAVAIVREMIAIRKRRNG